MSSELLLYIGSVLIIIWGMAHIFPTKSMADGFGAISMENRRILIMEWISEGLSLCFLGLLVILVTILGSGENIVSVIVYRAVAGILIIMAILTIFTGARSSIIPIKICPVVKTVSAILIFMGSLL